MIKLWHLFVNRQIVKVIQAAMVHDEYDQQHYLCNTIEHTSLSIWRKLAVKRICHLIDGSTTLYGHILNELKHAGWAWSECKSYTHLDWPEQKAAHVKFWNLAITALLNGHGKEPLSFTPDQLGLEKALIIKGIHCEDV
jgi:hypothetical protein